jgi:hypothetical protein
MTVDFNLVCRVQERDMLPVNQASVAQPGRASDL